MRKVYTDPKELAFHFILHNRDASLATVGKDGIPHVVAVYCVVRKDLTLYFMTRAESRKYANIIHQPKVGMMFYSEQSLDTLQLTGKAERVNDLKQEQEIWHDLMRFRMPWSYPGLPPVQLFEEGYTNELAIIKITPQEMTYASFVPSKNNRYKSHFQKII